MVKYVVTIAVISLFIVGFSLGHPGDTFLYDPPAENGSVAYDGPRVCNNPAPETVTTPDGMVITADRPESCIDPAPVNVPYMHDPLPRTVTVPGETPPPPPPPPPLGELVVSPSGSDSNPCTASAPCRSFQRAYNVATDGTVVSVGDGIYPIGVGNIETGTGKNVTFAGNLDGNKVRGINIGADNVTFDGINVDHDMVAARMGVYHHADNVTFRNSRIGNILNERGVLLAGSVNAVFDNVLFHDVLENDPNVHNECIQSYLGEGAVVRNSTFINCATMDWSLGYPGHWTPPPPPFGNITIDDNLFYCSRFGGTGSCHAYGLAIWSTQQQGLPGQPEFGWLHNFRIRRNWFENAVIVRPVRDGTEIICENTGVAPDSWKVVC